MKFNNVEFQEPDRKKNIKRVIAREGLIILAIVGIGFMLWYTGIQINPTTLLHDHLIGYGLFLIFIIYPVYWLIRFIVWAVRTSREK